MPNHQPKQKEVPIRLTFPHDTIGKFASFMVAQHQPEFFTMSFFEVMNPPLVGNQEQIDKTVDALKDIEAKCVSRINVTPSVMREIIKALTSNLQKYDEARKNA